MILRAREIDHYIFTLEMCGERHTQLGSEFAGDCDDLTGIREALEREGFTIVHIERITRPVYFG